MRLLMISGCVMTSPSAKAHSSYLVRRASYSLNRYAPINRKAYAFQLTAQWYHSVPFYSLAAALVFLKTRLPNLPPHQTLRIVIVRRALYFEYLLFPAPQAERSAYVLLIPIFIISTGL